MTQRLDARLNPHAPAVLSIFRIIFGLLFLCHGAAALFGVLGGPKVPVGTWPYWWAGLLELVCGILIAVGFLTRPAAFIASGMMAFAFFTEHLPNGFWPIQNGGEMSVMYCFAFLLLVFTGPGSFAVESQMGRGRLASNTTAPRRRWRR
jgi:putative oxidoreductase